jgi:hypothetical protein
VNIVGLQCPFINCTLDSKPIRDLLLEYKAEVVEEELLDEEAEVRSVYFISYVSLYGFNSYFLFQFMSEIVFLSRYHFSYCVVTCVCIVMTTCYYRVCMLKVIKSLFFVEAVFLIIFCIQCSHGSSRGNSYLNYFKFQCI